MKTKASKFRALSLKGLLITTFTFIGFVSATSCEAQSVVGKWKGVSTKYYYNAEYAKQIGKSTEEKTGKDLEAFDMNYNADHTYVMHASMPNSTEVIIMKGTWSLSGNKLTTTRELQHNPTKKSFVSTVSFNGNTMVQTTEEWPPPARIHQVITTCVKM